MGTPTTSLSGGCCVTDEELSEVTRLACEEATIALTVDTISEGTTSVPPEVSEAFGAGIHAGIYGLLKVLGERQLI